MKKQCCIDKVCSYIIISNFLRLKGCQETIDIKFNGKWFRLNNDEVFYFLNDKGLLKEVK